MKAMKKNDGVSPVIAVILMVAITVVLAGVVFLWAQSFTDEAGGGGEILNVRGTIDANGFADDTPDSYSGLEIEVISGTVSWSEYKVTIEGVQVYTETQAAALTAANAGSSSAGESQWFTIATYEVVAGTPLVAGTEYNVKIVNIGDNVVVWEDDIIATA